MTPDDPPVLTTRGLRKAFGRLQVVRGIGMEVARGEIVGLLGPNGAGKTTVMKMVVGLIDPDAGEIALFGVAGGARDKAIRARIGYLQEKPRIYPAMTARAYLRLFADLYGLPAARAAVAEALDRVGLAAAADRPLGRFSRGMQQRVCLARSMLNSPEFLILDEPTLGLDPNGVIEMRALLLELRAAGATLLFSSHQLAEMERITDRVIFLDRGEVIAAGPTDELLHRLAGGALMVETREGAALAVAAVRRLDLVAEAEAAGEHEIRVIPAAGLSADDCALRASFVHALIAAGVTPLSVRPERATLEEVFVRLTARPAGSGGGGRPALRAAQ